MEYVFNIAPADPERLWPQVSRTLEKRTELLSRRTYPRLWLLNDKICGEADYSEAGRRRRRRFRGWLGLAQYLLGLLFMVPCAMEPEALKARQIERLPETLGDAIEAFEGDPFMKKVLGDHIYTKYLEAKKKEWRAFRAQVTDWEISQYLYKY